MRFKLNLDKVHTVSMQLELTQGEQPRNSKTEWFINGLRLANGVRKILVGGTAEEYFDMAIEGDRSRIEPELLELLVEDLEYVAFTEGLTRPNNDIKVALKKVSRRIETENRAKFNW